MLAGPGHVPGDRHRRRGSLGGRGDGHRRRGRGCSCSTSPIPFQWSSLRRSACGALWPGAWNGLLVAPSPSSRSSPRSSSWSPAAASPNSSPAARSSLTDHASPTSATASSSGLPFPVSVALGCWPHIVPDAQTAIGTVHRIRRRQSRASIYAGVNGATVKFSRLRVFRLLRRFGRAGSCFQHQVRRRNHAGLFLELDAILAVVVGGTALTGGRFNLPAPSSAPCSSRR